MNDEIETIFKDFKVDSVDIPIAFIFYKGKANTFLTYASIADNAALSGDDEVLQSIIEYDIDIFTKGNFLNILKEVKKIMKINGWLWIGDSPDMYEEDTCFFHKTATFQKERSVN